MTDQELPRRVSEKMLTQPVRDELLVYDEDRHQAFCLNSSSAAIWMLCDGSRTVAEIAAAATRQLKAAADIDLVCFALAELRRDGLVEPPPLAAPLAVVSRRTLVSRLGAGAAMLLPAVAMVMAPTAAQAYNGCVDCDSVKAARQKLSH